MVATLTRKFTPYILPAMACLTLLACGGSSKPNSGSSSDAAADRRPAPTAAAQVSPTPSLPRFVAEDPAGDCLSSNQNTPLACEPGALDMRRLTVERDAAGNVLATIELTGGGFPALGQYTLLIGIDTDTNAATGNTSYAQFHGLAPDVELAYIVRTGMAPQSQLRRFPAGGQPALGDASLIEWKQLDPTRMQAVIKPGAIGTNAIWIVSDLNLADRYDHVPDNARISFPEGRLLTK